MSYTALEKMRKINKEKYSQYGVDGPIVPELKKTMRRAKGEKKISDLEEHVQNFIRESCEDLLFLQDEKHSNLVDTDGTSIKEGQIPYNMEKDLDRLCLENAVHRFLESGMEEDAFDIYYCYLEMFIGDYSKSRRMIETLAEFESNASSLLEKHRDHYSHSVYVFLIGLAVYDSNSEYKEKYKTFYNIEDGKEAAHHFLKYWGLTSLFHDIGYPFEIPFEQVKSYFFKEEKKEAPFVSYSNMATFTDIIRIDTDATLWEKLMLGENTYKPQNLNDILAHNTAYRLKDKYVGYKNYYDYNLKNPDKGYREYLAEEILAKKPSQPDKFGKFMDHAYFSAVLLFRQLIEVVGVKALEEDAVSYMDSLTAILLHNSLYKFSITDYKSQYNNGHEFDVDTHPLAYLLMLADELQCWDRTSYGLNSRQEVHAMDCELDFSADKITANYIFDTELEKKANKEGTKGTYKKLVTPSKERSEFLTDIEKIVHINDGEKSILDLEVRYEFREDDRLKKKYLSDSNFIHLYDFAVVLNGRYTPLDEQLDDSKKEQKELSVKEEENLIKDLVKDFQKMSLEYKLSNIGQARAFAKYLDVIGCFYTDKPVIFELVKEFKEEDQDMQKIGPLEHERWLREHADMGWQEFNRDKFKELGDNGKAVRELTRCHINMTNEKITSESAKAHFDTLTDGEKGLDIKPMNTMLKLVDKFDGLRIYRL